MKDRFPFLTSWYWIFMIWRQHQNMNTCDNTLVQWNVIMYANVTLPLTLVSNKQSILFSPRYFSGIKIVTVFTCIFEETMPQLSVNFRNRISQNSHKNQYPGLVCNISFTAPQYGDKCWSNLFLKCHIILIGNTHRTPVRSSNSCSGWFVWNQYTRIGLEA